MKWGMGSGWKGREVQFRREEIRQMVGQRSSPRADRVEDMEQQVWVACRSLTLGLHQSPEEFKNILMLGLSPTGLGFGPGIVWVILICQLLENVPLGLGEGVVFPVEVERKRGLMEKLKIVICT